MDKSKVFLSSTQFNDEFKTERELIPIIFQKEPLSSIFEIYKIETNASANPIEPEYLRNLHNSNVVILLIDSIIREAVKKEIKEAEDLAIPIFAFIRINENRSEEAKKFISEIQNSVTTTQYNSIIQLTNIIEDSLLSFYSPRLNCMEESENLQKSEQFDLKERSLKIALYALNKNSSKITTQKILPLLISECLIDKELTINEIKEIVPVADKSLIDTAINQMFSDMDIFSSNEKLSLSAHKISALKKVINSVDQKEKSTKKLIASQYASRIDMASSDFLIYLDKCLALIIYKTTTKVVDYQSSIGEDSYDSDALKKIILDSVISCLNEKDNFSEWQKILLEILTSKNKEIVEWINCINKSFWFLAALDCNKEVAGVFLDNIENYQAFLDSHIVLRGIVKSGPSSSVCTEILTLGNKLNLKMFISEDIYSEVKIAFEQADNIINSCNGDIKRVESLFEQLGRNHDIIDAYFTSLKYDKDLSWDNFLGQYYSFSNDNVLKTYLKNILKIDIFKSEEYPMSDWAEIEDIRTQLLQKRRGSVKKAIENSSNPEKEEERQNRLRENEAKQLFILYHLRHKIAPNYWFITYDSFVYDVCIDIYKRSNCNQELFPCFIKPNKWLEILKLSDRDYLNEPVFYDTLMGSALHHAVSTTEAEVIAEILKKNIDEKIKDKEMLNIMFSEAVKGVATSDIKDEIRGITKNQNISCSNDLEEIIKSVLYDRLGKYDQIFKKQNEEINTAKQLANKEHKRVRYFKSQLARLTRKRK